MRGGWNFFFKINKRASTFIREMRVHGVGIIDNECRVGIFTDYLSNLSMLEDLLSRRAQVFASQTPRYLVCTIRFE